MSVVDVENEPQQVGYCHNPQCAQHGVEVRLFKNLTDVPVMCGCGHLLEADRVPDDGDAPEPAVDVSEPVVDDDSKAKK